MSIIAAIILAVIVWIVCAYVVPDDYPMITENGLAIGAVVGLGAWVYPKVMSGSSGKHGYEHV